MFHRSWKDYVEITIDKALTQMLYILNGGVMVSILPKYAFPVFSNIVFLTRTTSYQLDWPGYHIPTTSIATSWNVRFQKVYDRYSHMLNTSRPYILKRRVEDDFGSRTISN